MKQKNEQKINKELKNTDTIRMEERTIKCKEHIKRKRLYREGEKIKTTKGKKSKKKKYRKK